MNGRTILIAASTITILGALYYLNAPSSLVGSMSATLDSDTIPGLEFKLSQISRNPPSLLVTLKNTSPTPYTLLKWATPLDVQAQNLGVFKVVDEASGEVLDIPQIKINRLMPPAPEDLVTVAPGTEEATEIVFDKPWMPEAKPAKYQVRAEGTFAGVWDRYGNEVSKDEVAAYSESPLNGKTFRTNVVQMRVE